MRLCEEVKGFKNHVKIILITTIIVSILFYLPIGYVFGSLGNVTVLRGFNDKQVNEIKSVCDLNIPDDSKIKNIKAYYSLQNLSLVITINKVEDIKNFLSDNPQIEVYQPVGDLNLLFPNGFHYPKGTAFTGYYFNKKAYVAVSQNNMEYGKKVVELF